MKVKYVTVFVEYFLQEVEKLIMNNMDEIVVEVLMTLHEEKSSESHFIR